MKIVDFVNFMILKIIYKFALELIKTMKKGVH